MTLQDAEPVARAAIGRSSQERVAKAIGVDGSVISRWLRGLSTPEGSSKERILNWAERQTAATTDLQTNAAAWLVRERTAKGYTVEQAAEALGTTPSTVEAWEAGTRRPVPIHFAAIERVYQVPASTLRALWGDPLTGSGLGYWIGRWEQAVIHLERVMTEQQDIVAHMKARAQEAEPPSDEEAAEVEASIKAAEQALKATPPKKDAKRRPR